MNKILTVTIITVMVLGGILPQISAKGNDAVSEAPGDKDMMIPMYRPFNLGMTPWPYDLTPQAQDDVYDMIRDHDDMIAHHLDGGVPWVEAFDNSSFQANVTDNLDERIQKTPSGQTIYLAITPISGGRDGLAKYWGDMENKDRPGEWATMDFDSPKIIIAYTNYCRYVIDKFQPKYFTYGIEVNILKENGPVGSFDKFVTLVEHVYPILKKEYPTLPLILSLHIGTYAKDKLGQRQAIDKILPYTDYIAVSTYPYLAHPNPKDIPQDWFSQMAALAPEKPFAIAETGFMAEDFNVTNPLINVPGNEQWQRDYVGMIMNESHFLDARFIVWFVAWDYDLMWEKIWQYVPWYTKMWRDCGLVNGTGVPRPSLTLWDDWLKLPLVPPNDPPIIINMSPKATNITINETEMINLTIEVHDDDIDNLSFEWKVDGDIHETWNEAYYHFITDYESSRLHIINVTVHDSMDPAFDIGAQWNIMVLDVNRLPQIDSYEPENVTTVSEEGSGMVNFSVEASDADNDPLTYVWTLDGVELIDMIGPYYIFSYNHSSAGKYAINVTIEDKLTDISMGWTLYITDVNRAPTIDDFFPEKEYSIDETSNGSFQFTINATDPDGDSLGYQWSLNGTDLYQETGRTYSFRYNYSSKGTYLVTVAITDGDLVSSVEWTLTVNNTDRPPYFTQDSGGPANITVGERFNYRVWAIDPDHGDTLAWSLKVPVDNMTIDPSNGEIQWTPTKNQVGDIEFTILVSDGNLSIEWVRHVKVLPRPRANEAPQITPIPIQTISVNDIFELSVMATDPDPWDRENLSFYLVEGPEGLIIGNNSGVFSWRPTKSDVGTVKVIVGVTDGKANTESSFIIEVQKKEKVNKHAEETIPLAVWLLLVLCTIEALIIILLYVKNKGPKAEDPRREEDPDGGIETQEVPGEDHKD